MLQNRIKLIFMILLIIFEKSAFSANILYLCALPSPSHHIWNSALANALAARGHNVTVASVDKDERPPNGVHYIHFEGIYNNEGHEELLRTLFERHSDSNMSPLTEPSKYDSLWYENCKVIFRTKGFNELLNYPDDFHFDAIIYDFTPGACLLGFMHRFNYPQLVSVTAYGNPSILNTFIGGHQFYSYIPNNYLLFKGEMNFGQRMYNFVVHLIEYYNHKKIFNAEIDELSADIFGFGSAEKLEEKTLIALVNTNPAFDYLAPLPENVIPVGGLHIRETKKLPQDLENFINASKKGTILFSLGTNVLSYLMDGMKRKIILDAFAQLPDYHFMWKFEKNVTGFDLPENVMVRPWLPQSDILAHPRVMAFFTHCGLLSTQESIWRGVPIIGMPFVYDQHRNLIKSIELGFAEKVDFHTMTTAGIKEKLMKVLEDPAYKRNAIILSKRFRDQKEKPIDRAVWWVEWVLRNPNADYLRSPVLRLGFIVGNSYDLIAFITFIFTIVIFIAMKIIWHCIVSKKKTKQLKTE